MLSYHRSRLIILLSVCLTLELPFYGRAWSPIGPNNHRHCPPTPRQDDTLCKVTRQAINTDELAKAQPMVLASSPPVTRRHVFTSTTTALGIFTGVCMSFRNNLAHAAASTTSCSDIETCREIGERKDAANLAANPIHRVSGYPGLQYKVLNPGLGEETVSETSKMVKIMYSISQANGRYMYSRGFGFNKVKADGGGKLTDMMGGQQTFSDYGIDGLIVDMTQMNKNDSRNTASSTRVLPIGIQRAMVGMKRGERRRIQCPQDFGFETSDWNPKPTDFRGQQQIKDYQALIWGRGDTQPAFASPTIWDVEVISIRG